MAHEAERDPVTGQETTGHEWDGIKELNTPLPRWWVYLFWATIAWSVVWWILYPSWPWLTTYYPGLLGSNQRIEFAERWQAAEAERAAWLDRIRASELEEIAADPELFTFASRGGEVVFKENCAACHGLGGAGQRNYPSLADDDWLWGGRLEDILLTIRHGIRDPADPDTRESRMPAFAELLAPEEIADVASYVLSLSGQASDPEAAARGAALFAEQCVACHGDDGRGIREVGAPNLTDAIWLYGSSPEAVQAQIADPRHGVMPAWAGRLSEEALKMVAIYVHALGGGE